MGDTHYRLFVEHRRRAHPCEPIPTERQYWAMRYAAAEADPAVHCC